MSEENKVLDLDELFGQAKAIKVRWEGQEYEFLRMETFSPRQLVQFNQIHIESEKLKDEMAKTSASEEEKEALGDQIENLLDKMLITLCPKFPVDEINFMRKSAAIQFYMEQTQAKNAKRAMLKKPIGENPSRG